MMNIPLVPQTTRELNISGIAEGEGEGEGGNIFCFKAFMPDCSNSGFVISCP